MAGGDVSTERVPSAGGGAAKPGAEVRAPGDSKACAGMFSCGRDEPGGTDPNDVAGGGNAVASDVSLGSGGGEKDGAEKGGGAPKLDMPLSAAPSADAPVKAELPSGDGGGEAMLSSGSGSVDLKKLPVSLGARSSADACGGNSPGGGPAEKLPPGGMAFPGACVSAPASTGTVSTGPVASAGSAS